jgi:hypothetical protein
MPCDPEQNTANERAICFGNAVQEPDVYLVKVLGKAIEREDELRLFANPLENLHLACNPAEPIISPSDNNSLRVNILAYIPQAPEQSRASIH